MKAYTFPAVFFAFLFFLTTSVRAQSPAPIIVQAASPVAALAATPAALTPSATDSESMVSMIKTLEEMKAKNADTLQKQEATLQQLDELQQAAQQLKIFSKRG